jgi:cytoskeletal protein CcmA (bactofilin family)
MRECKEKSMLRHLFKRLVILPILALLVLLPAAPALAADLRGGDAVIVASGDVIDDDLYIAASQIVINGTVNGDVLCVGDTITVNGTINGSISVLGMTISINGDVTHAVRVGGDTVAIRGNVGGDVLVAGSDVNMARTAKIGRDLLFAASKIRVDALIADSIKGAATTASLGDGVGGNAEMGIENLTIESTADIKGNLIYTSKNEANIVSGARIGGTTTHKLPEQRKPAFPASAAAWMRVMAFLMTLVTGGLIILLAPKRAGAVAASIRQRPWLSLGWGAIIFFATPAAAIIALITVIGVPAGLIGLVVYGIALYLSQIAVGLFIGSLIVGRFSKVDSKGVLLGAFAIGFVILTLVKLIPYAGFPIWLATVLFGLGAMALSQKTLQAGKAARPEVLVT